MINCPPDLKKSDNLAIRRQEKAVDNLGIDVVNRILGFALFLFGMNRQEIARLLKTSYGTFLSFLSRVDQYGISSFQDRRKTVSVCERVIETSRKIEIIVDANTILIQLGGKNQILSIPRGNALQCKVILLSFVNSGLLSEKDISHVLGISERHLRELKEKLQSEDVYSLIDKRKGQSSDYRFSPEVKSELVLQYAAHAITGKPTSSRYLSESIAKRCHFHLPDRSIRLHVKKLGLSRIAKSLPALVKALKKTNQPDSGEDK